MYIEGRMKKFWRNVKQYSFVKNVDMNLRSGWGSALDVKIGIH